MFDYTQKTFWGGSWYPYWTLILTTILGGFFGLDHFWLRSPTSGLLKFFVNICTLGLWYFYDIIQILGEKEIVMKYGLSAPIVGPLGIGAGMFIDDNPNGPVAKSPLTFLAYMILLWIPFGFDFFIAGDSNGGIAKFLCTFIFLLWPVAFIWGMVNCGYAIFTPKSLFTQGTYRMFPVSWVMDPYGPSKLGPLDIPAGSGKCSKEGLTNTVESIGSGFMGTLFGVFNSFTRSILNIIAPQVTVAATAVSAATSAIADTTQTVATTLGKTANSAQQIINAATKPAVQVAANASKFSQQSIGAIHALPDVGSTITDKLGSLTTPEGLLKLAALHPAVRAASIASKSIGSLPVIGSVVTDKLASIPTSASLLVKQSGGSGANDISTIALLVLFTVLLGGGTFMAVRRMNLTPSLSTKKNNVSDTPPEPRNI